MYIDLNNALVFMLVMLRMTGLLVFSPIFGRQNIPSTLTAGFAFLLAVVLTAAMPFPTLPDPTLAALAFMAFAELAVGYVAGVLINAFLSIMVIGGEVVDMQMGLAMANIFDPNTNMSMALTATMFNAMFILAFFITGNHLTFIYMVSQTFSIIPIGGAGFTPQFLFFIPSFFSTIFLFAIKLCLPMVVVQIITTLAVGVIMRIVPQINIFVLNIQIKLLIGIFVLVVLIGPVMAMFENLWTMSFERIWEIWQLMEPQQ